MQVTHMRCLQPRAATHRVLLTTPAAVAPAVCASSRHNRPSPLMQPSVLLSLAMGNTMQQQHQRQRHQQQQWAPLPPVQAASDSSSGSSSGSDPQKPRSGLLNWFDRLPQQTQLMVMGGFLFIGAVVIPFFQPTFLYGDGSMDASVKARPGSGQITEVQGNPYTKQELPRYIPVASELYSFLQDNAMPRTLPDGRSDSPGVLRIYMASMVILATFYACSAVLSLILKGVAGILRAVGVMGPAPPPPKPEAP